MGYHLLNEKSICLKGVEYTPISSKIMERSCFYSSEKESVLVYLEMNRNWKGFFDKNYIQKTIKNPNYAEFGDLKDFKVNIEEFMNGTIDLEFHDYSDDSGVNFFTFGLKKFLQDNDKDLLEEY